MAQPVDVTIATDPKEAEPVVVVVDGPGLAESGSDAPEAGIEALKKQIAELEAARKADQEEAKRANERAAAAERARAETAARLTAEADKAHTAVKSREQTELDSVTNALERSQQEMTALVAQKAALLKDGEFDKAAPLDVLIGRAAARIENLENGKVALEAAVKAPNQQRQQTLEERQDEFISKQTVANQTWIRQNRDRFFADPLFQRKATDASGYALNVLGHREGSPEYFKFIDIAVGNRQPDKAEEKSEEKTPVSAAARPASPAAPPSRSAPPSQNNGGQPGTVTLTRDEMNLCETMGITPVAYARQREALRREGKLT